jgi:hypothetical protein
VPDLDLTDEPSSGADEAKALANAGVTIRPYSQEETRENTRGDLARGLLWLLTFAIGGVLAFIGLGRLDGTVLTQSIFPSLIALAGTALGFYFGSQTAKETSKEPDPAAMNRGAAGNGGGRGGAQGGDGGKTGI